MTLKLLEPLRELFKDEVRTVGEELGLPHRMVWRHPFPGPGLGVRILGEVKKEYCDILRQADAIYIEELYQTVATTTKSARPSPSFFLSRVSVLWVMVVLTSMLSHYVLSRPKTL